MSGPMSLLLVGKVRPERKRSLTGMAMAAKLPLVAIEESSEAIAWLEVNDPGCVIVDAGATRLDRVIAAVRTKRELSHVPVFALVSAPDDLWIEQYFSWGGDDVVQMDAGATLLERLRAVPREAPKPVPGRRAVIADPDRTRIEVLSRAFGLAGFDVRFGIDRQSLEFVVKQFDPHVVIANSVLGELPEVIARTRQGLSNTAAWGVMAARRELDAQQAALGNVPRCFVVGVQTNPWQILLRANDLSRDESVERRRETRRQFGSFVLFRAAGSDDDDIGVAYNLSAHGMFVRTHAPVLSEDVWLEWRVPQDKTRVRLEGKVVWRQSSLSESSRVASPLGFGVEFCDYLGGARKHLERALEVLDGGAKRGGSARPAAMVNSPVGSGQRARTEADLARPVATVSSAAAGEVAEESVGTTSQGDASADAVTTSSRMPSVKALTQALPLAIESGNIPVLSTAKPFGSRALTKPLAPAPNDAPNPPEPKPSPVAGVAADTTQKLASRVADSSDAGSAKPSQSAPASKSAPPPEPAKRAVRATPLESTTRASVPPTAPAEARPEPKPKIRSDREPFSASSAGRAGGSSDGVPSQAATRRQPLPPSSTRTSPLQISRLNAPAQRPRTTPAVVVAPPRPGGVSPFANTVVGASTIVGIGGSPPASRTGEPGARARSASEQPPTAEVAVPRVDALPELSTFDGIGDTTSPNAQKEMFNEDARISAEPTEIVSNPTALFEIAEDSMRPKHEVHEDAPTAVAPPLSSLAADVFDRGPIDALMPVAQDFEGAFFATDELETRQWNAPAASGAPPQPFGLQPELHGDEQLGLDEFLPPRRSWGKILVAGLLLVAAGIAGGGYWLYATGRIPSGKSSASRAVAERREAPAGASASTVTVGIAEAPAVAVPSAADAPDAAAAPSAEPGETPRAPVGDGQPLEGYPAVQEFKLGSGRELSERYGYLVVRFPEAAYIFSNNLPVGATNWKIATTCGEKVLRVGVGEKEKPVTWLSDAMKVNVPCRDTTHVVFRRLPDVIAPPGVMRPVLPGSVPARKSAKDSEKAETDGAEVPEPQSKTPEAPSVAQPAAAAPEVPAEAARGIIDTRE